MLSTLLLLLITPGCVSKPKAEIVIPPEPERVEMPEVHSVAEMAERINQYEHLVQLWEQWAEDVKGILKGYNDSIVEIK